MNKKIHVLLAALGLFVGTSVNAQPKVLSQTGGLGPDSTAGSLTCGGGAPDLQIGENSFWRAYTITDSSIDLGTVRVGIRTVTGNVPITVKLYESNGGFPASYPSGLTLLGSGTVNLSSSNDFSLVDVALTNPVTVTSGKIIVVEVNNAAATNPNNTYGMGVVTGNETAPAYLTASTCGLTVPQTIEQIAIANGLTSVNPKIIIDLVEAQATSAEDFFKSNFTLYPNPVVDVLNIRSINDLNVNEVRVLDLSGRVVKTQNDVSSINVSDLTAGAYLIEITTNEGKATSKFIKK